MKKQILFLTLFVLAVFAGMNKSFGQTYQTVPTATPTCLTPTPLECDTVAYPELHPVQGEEYTYTVASTPTGATIRWFVVNNLDVTTNNDSLVSIVDGILPEAYDDIDATTGDGSTGGAYDVTSSTYVMSVTNGANVYNSQTNTATSLTMSWKFFNGSAPNEVLLVAYVEDSVDCTNNIAVWRIIPTPSFTLDVAAMAANGDSIAPAGSSGVAQDCVSPIEYAIYNSNLGSVDPSTTPGDSLIVDYGENWVFFVVNAANFIDSWMPTFQFTYTGGDDIPVFEASWAYIGDATTSTTGWNAISGTLGTAASNFTTANPVIAGGSAASPGTVGAGVVPAAAGECIIVRARLDWGKYIEHDELLSTLRFAVDGVYYDGNDSATDGGSSFFNDRGYADLDVTNCADDNWTNDWVDYDITPRPQVEEGTPDFEDKSGNGIN